MAQCVLLAVLLASVAVVKATQRLVYVKDKCGQSVALEAPSSYFKLCHIGVEATTKCDVAVVAESPRDRLLIHLQRSNIENTWKWIDIIDGGTNLDILRVGFNSRSPGLVTTGNNATLRFHFHTTAYRKDANKRPKWELLVTRYRPERSENECDQHMRHKRGAGYWKKKKHYDDDDDDDEDDDHARRHGRRKFFCDASRCIDEHLRCDGDTNCDDASDERHCRRSLKWICMLVGSCLVAVLIVSVIGVIIWRKKRGSFGDQNVEVDTTSEKAAVTDSVTTDEKPPVDPVFCVEAGAVGGFTVTPSGDVNAEHSPPRYTSTDEVDGTPVSLPQDPPVPTTPPPEYRSHPASEKDLTLD